MLADVPIPQTMFTRVGGNRIAYQVVGEGPPDLLWLSGLGEPIDARWDYPPCASFVRRLASFTRLIMFDRRGVGASDPVPLESLPSWERWADEATAVLDTVGSTRSPTSSRSTGVPRTRRPSLFRATLRILSSDVGSPRAVGCRVVPKRW